MIRGVLESFPLDFEILYIRQASQERWILVRYFQHAGDDNVILVGETTAEELSHWSAELKQASSLSEAAEDLFWALLNSREFAFNH